MGKFINQSALDSLLNFIADNADRIHFCYGEPDSYSDVTNHTLGYVNVTTGDGNGDYLIESGSGGSRKLKVTEQTFTPTSTGMVDNVVFVDTVDEFIVAITTSLFRVTNGTNKTVPEFYLVEILQPQ